MVSGIGAPNLIHVVTTLLSGSMFTVELLALCRNFVRGSCLNLS